MDYIVKRIYATCTACGETVYRIPGYRHGDGQLDTDENPVWLLADWDNMTQADKDMSEKYSCQCGCTD